MTGTEPCVCVNRIDQDSACEDQACRPQNCHTRHPSCRRCLRWLIGTCQSPAAVPEVAAEEPSHTEAGCRRACCTSLGSASVLGGLAAARVLAVLFWSWKKDTGRKAVASSGSNCVAAVAKVAVAAACRSGTAPVLGAASASAPCPDDPLATSFLRCRGCLCTCRVGRAGSEGGEEVASGALSAWAH